jgi:hypothetical protein
VASGQAASRAQAIDARLQPCAAVAGLGASLSTIEALP